MENTDSDGFNIGKIINKTIDEMASICKQIPFAVAFNSDGMVKYYVSPTSIKYKKGVTLFVLDRIHKELEFAKKLPPIMCINLERRPDRRESMMKKNIEINFCRAIDGKQLTPTPQLQYLFRNNDFNFRRGVAGAALSHYVLWNNLMQSNEDAFLIIEDDVDFCQDFMPKFSNAYQQVSNYDWEFLYLGFSSYERKLYELEFDNNSYPQVLPFDTRQFYGAGFFGYIINKKGVQRMLKYIEVNGIDRAIDCLPPTDKDCKRFMTFPHLIKTPCYNNNSVDTDIQTDYDSLINQ